MLTAVKPQAKISKKRIIQADQSSFSDYSASKRSLGKKVREWELVRVVGGIYFYKLPWNVPIYIRPIISYEIKFYKGLCNMPIAGSLNQIWSECFNEIILLTKTISFIPRSCPLPSPPPTVIWLLNFQTPKAQPLKLDNCRPARQTK